MKASLKIEELFMFIFGIYLFSELNYSWWWFVALILVPDIGMLGYLWNPKIGAIIYNVFHHKAIAISVYFLGIIFQNDLMELAGIILFSHACFDRVCGYGLKYFDSFKNTHLGRIGK
ncbi:DUF4260 domain-containing protein [Flavivirga sp. 57AJ16]|uniref:DUF4260 domain-containing protein n=1 Tax=Flavivirga sp. 57AJ16 TaxID=3025307 RepID=UPI00236726E3|nr:DUF4260 domain-containing protein [Flavivirga sp. 57AJ16]MDD7886815.1 DUF4260 domain-containing protein [Flavivirga sp. 57AJ16]